ncbi:hypothetical protein CARUB_v10018747mg [Capsella rubella]|uniref:UDP-glycosyltransferases domain-containing protein n=1 Tax=Capsella rubella TaxID=81985 RepID=R0HJL9_9BRAS|nr:hypothetical protein CARUB_v10018747mg [Capsella rubella]
MEKIEAKRRIVLVPLPAQGHVTPMMQLGKALYSEGFSIIVVERHFNQVSSSSYQKFPGFQFITLKESLPESELERLGGMEFMIKLNKTSETSFKDSQFLIPTTSDIACIIYDEFMFFSGAVAKDTQCATNCVSCCILSKLNADEFLVDMEASAVIINAVSCLESSSLSLMEQNIGIPIYHIGPLHMIASQPSSLLEEDRSSIEWLNKQKPRSVIYVSVGTVVQMEPKEQPAFLWVIRPVLIPGFNGIESLPEEVSKMVLERGYIVKRAPQIEVLGHHAVGGFWSHCGWNSILESIAQGVPLICKPFHGEQKLNAMYVESVWRIGFLVEGSEVDRGEVERAVKRLIVDEEGAMMQERALVLKEKLKASVKSGGTSYNSLDKLVKNLKTM